jgi:hypothetical protein
MKNRIIVITAALALNVVANSNAATQEESSITAEAAAVLSEADATVKQCISQGTLWTSGAEALGQAKSAAAKGDSPSVISRAKAAIEQARLSTEQVRYPIVQ